MITVKQQCCLQYFGAEWCLTSFVHTQCTLSNVHNVEIEALPNYNNFGCTKVAISVSTEAFLCQKSKKQQHQQSVHLLHTISQIKRSLHVIKIHMIIYINKKGKYWALSI